MAPPTLDDGNSLFDFVVKHGNGVKGLAESGLTRVPDRYIQPPNEQIHVTQIARLHNHPAIDLSKLDGPDHDQVADTIVKAAETLGFFQVVNHGVPVVLLESLKRSAHLFFAQPPHKKAVYLEGVSPSPLVKYGTSVLPEKEKALEWKDYISMVYINDKEALEFWPPQCKEVALEYLKSSTKTVKNLLQVLIKNLGVELDDESRVVDTLVGFKMVNMNFYPACPNPELTVGVGRHSDMGTLTVLLQDGIGGLYVKEEGKTNGVEEDDQWIQIPPIPGALVINIGDTLEIISNGRYKSAEHRVRTTSTQSRVSIPLFIGPQLCEKIGPLPWLAELDGVARYRDVIVEDYMNHFFGQAHDGKKSRLDFVKIIPR